MLLRCYSLNNIQKSTDEKRESLTGANPLEELKLLLAQTASEILLFVKNTSQELDKITTVEEIVEHKEVCQFFVKIKKVFIFFLIFLRG